MVRNSVTLLRSLDDPAVLRHFRLVVGHPHPRVRQEVLKTLLHFRHPEADRQLVKEMSSSDVEMQLFAIQMAEQSQDPQVLARLRKFLGGKVLSETDFELKSAVLRTLGKIGDPQVLPDMAKLLEAKSLLRSSLLKRLKGEVVRSLANYPLAAVLPLLDKLEKGGGELALQATEVRRKCEVKG